MPERKFFDQALRELQDNILRLSSMVDEALEKSMLALETRNGALAREVRATDQVINELRYSIEDSAVLILATQAPAATDLRFVLACIIISEELERMGDHASGIASLVGRLREGDQIESLHKLPKMAKRARNMLRLSIQSFVERNADLAYEVIVMDDKLDRQYRKLFYQAMSEMNDPEYVRMATFLMWVGHDLERIGDRATNIAERTIYMLTSKHIEVLGNRDTDEDGNADDDDDDIEVVLAEETDVPSEE